ncbi:hypothetical protein PSQ19_17185 [Devosia algicola]|uniref:O-antigen ligase domain-containing protein n=1 Tax=Devosia algicola TaxID=3026418 RepID=A0ABY7YMM4_9HYPH|nr:hypothetical protein [Devosia algicola]WDR02335.1 hypothetical protein PSQ19_17185 [Devosia algicola]
MNVLEWKSNDVLALRILEISRALLLVAIAASALYQLQRYSLFPFAATGRFALFVGVLVLVSYARPRLITSIPTLIWCLAATVAWAGVNTYLLFGPQLALAATARFANVMIVAPLASVLFTDQKHIGQVFAVYVLVLTVAFLSMIYQYYGGTLEAIVGSYIAIRADLVRYMTVVGEPNVGGMVAVLGFIVGVTIPKRMIASVIIAGVSVAFVVMTLSKAALVGLALAVGMLIFMPTKDRSRIISRSTISGLLGLTVLFCLGANNYLITAFQSVLGNIPGEPSVIGDLANRQLGGGLSEVPVAGVEASSYHWRDAIGVLFGLSFGIAGSAAQEILGSGVNVVLPHNSYMEMYLTGGIVMLGVMVILMANAFRRIVSDVLRSRRAEEQCALVCMTVLSCWMFVYPIIYEPATGALFWSIIGYGNRLSHSKHED